MNRVYIYDDKIVTTCNGRSSLLEEDHPGNTHLYKEMILYFYKETLPSMIMEGKSHCEILRRFQSIQEESTGYKLPDSELEWILLAIKGGVIDKRIIQ